METFYINNNRFSICLERAEYFRLAKNINGDNKIKMEDFEYKEFLENLDFLQCKIGFHTNNKSFLLLDDYYYVDDTQYFDIYLYTSLIGWIQDKTDDVVSLIPPNNEVFQYLLNHKLSLKILTDLFINNDIKSYIKSEFSEEKLYYTLASSKLKSFKLYERRRYLFIRDILNDFDWHFHTEHENGLFTLTQRVVYTHGTDEYVYTMKALAKVIYERINNLYGF